MMPWRGAVKTLDWWINIHCQFMNQIQCWITKLHYGLNFVLQIFRATKDCRVFCLFFLFLLGWGGGHGVLLVVLMKPRSVNLTPSLCPQPPVNHQAASWFNYNGSPSPRRWSHSSCQTLHCLNKVQLLREEGGERGAVLWYCGSSVPEASEVAPLPAREGLCLRESTRGDVLTLR